MGSGNTPGNGKGLLSIPQVAAICGVGFRTAARWLRHGRLRPEGPPSSEPRVTREQLCAFLAKEGRELPEALRQPSRRRALIVEDDRAMAHAIERTLLRLGFETRVAADGIAASRAYRDYGPHLVTLDLGLPEIQGGRLLELFRACRPAGGGKVIVISGGSDAQIMRALDGGSQGFLRKPFRAEQLVAVVNELLPTAA